MKDIHMGAYRFSALGLLGLLALAACEKAPEQPAAATPVVSAPSASASSAVLPAAAVNNAAPSPEPAPVTAGYPMCSGQNLTPATPPPRAGAVSVQLAPGFLDQMSSCKAEDSLPKDVLARAGSGTVDAKGDCVFANIGVSCHYHSASEFIESSTKEEPADQGELHCIFPGDDPKSPRVFGTHLACTDPTRGKPLAHAEHAAKVGAACGVGLLNQLASCQGSKCCDDGTLTTAIGELVRDGKNDVRPDFRICEQTLTLDCSSLENMSAHVANAPSLGGIAKPLFSVAAAPAEHVAHAKKPATH